MSGDARTRYLSLFVRMASVYGAEVERWSDEDITAAYIALKTSNYEEWQGVMAAADPVATLPDKLTPEIEAANRSALSDLGLDKLPAKPEKVA